MTNAVIIFLREVLEAMLIVSLLLAACTELNLGRRWIGLALLTGLAGAGVYAAGFGLITDSFAGTGQEIVNAASLFGIAVSLFIFSLFVVSSLRPDRPGLSKHTGLIALVAGIALAITREGAEIYIYVSGYLRSPEPVLPMVLGSILGAGIGLSIGALIYYGLRIMAGRRSLITICLLLVPVGAGMVSQGANYLIQANLLPAQLPLWDTSVLVREGSVPGELLYALFSYEATPTPLQVVLYLVSAGIMVAGMLLAIRMREHGDDANLAQP